MELVEKSTDSAVVRLSGDDLVLISNALNEVSRGVSELDDDNEFATRLGCSRTAAKALQTEFRDVVRSMKRAED